MSAGIKANNDGSAAIQVGGSDYITISSAGAVAIPQTLAVTGAATLPTIKSNASATPPTIQDSAGTQIGTFCRAWVNFNGTTNVGGFCTIRASFNVTSVADNGTGDYTVNFTTAMPDANYSPSFMCQFATTGGAQAAAAIAPLSNAQTTTSMRIYSFRTDTAASTDFTVVGVSFFR